MGRPAWSTGSRCRSAPRLGYSTDAAHVDLPHKFPLDPRARAGRAGPLILHRKKRRGVACARAGRESRENSLISSFRTCFRSERVHHPPEHVRGRKLKNHQRRVRRAREHRVKVISSLYVEYVARSAVPLSPAGAPSARGPAGGARDETERLAAQLGPAAEPQQERAQRHKQQRDAASHPRSRFAAARAFLWRTLVLKSLHTGQNN